MLNDDPRRDREAREWAQLAFDNDAHARKHVRMRKQSIVLAILVFGGMLLYGHCAQAQAFECPPDGETHAAPRRATLTHEGETGLWLRGDLSRCLTVVLDESRRQYTLLQERLALRDDQLADVREAVQLSTTAEERATGALAASDRGRREATEALAFERKLRWLWFGLGVVVVVVVEALAIWALGAVSP